MPARQVQIKMKGTNNFMKLFLYIKLFYLDLKIKRLNKILNKLREEYKEKYLGL